MNILLLIILVLVVVALLPAGPFAHGWGYFPSGGVGLVLIVLLILVLLGRV